MPSDNLQVVLTIFVLSVIIIRFVFTAVNRILPEQLQSPLLTAEWEHKLKLVEHGELDADEFMAEISHMVSDLVKTYTAVKGAEVLFPSRREVIGKSYDATLVMTDDGSKTLYSFDFG